jgi:hypothetical protein
MMMMMMMIDDDCKTYVDVSGVTTAGRAADALLVGWIAITLGRFIGLQDQVTRSLVGTANDASSSDRRRTTNGALSSERRTTHDA